VIAGNQCLSGPGFGGGGGGILVINADLTVKESTITNNRVVSGAGFTSAGIFTFAAGGGVEGQSATSVIRNSTIAGNRAAGGPGSGVADGGGIRVFRGSATMTDCFIRDNRAVGGAGGGHANGGGLLDVAAEVTVHNCQLTGNQAVGADGGFDGQAIGGGAAHYFRGGLSLVGSTSERNRAAARNRAFLAAREDPPPAPAGVAIADPPSAHL